jgi:hypothetical protein
LFKIKMPTKFSVSVKVAYKKVSDVKVAGRVPSKKEICKYLKSKKFVTPLAKRMTDYQYKVTGAKLDEQLNLTFTATAKSDVTASRVKEDISGSVGIEKCSGSEFPGPCFIPSADGKQVLAIVKISGVKASASGASSPRKQSRKTPSKRVSPKTPKRKDCPSDKIRNPATGRCVSKSGPTGKDILRKTLPRPGGKYCGSGRIYDPVERKCVSKTSAVGKKLVAMSPKRTGKSCPSDSIVNPATGRCVKKSGPIGKKILAKN